MPFALVQDLEHRGMIVRSAREDIDLHLRRGFPPTEQKSIGFECSRPLTIDELTQAWNQIAEALTDIGSPAPPSTTRMAESFRKRQNKLE